ncbi:sensor histidine kinase [Paenibacillus ginsengarvi]|uniref:histidine kinase n=1 Tax=Paenibacillus ginsengarvi TaxID=400777 RepID=A0A3B0CJI0_9BACL|nr:sensor histidine kinase [Paenibacillus ginsengarvi]RKN84858.1 sensor histidine kinase [Paenibacillus ginsengarvi]
MEKRRHHILQLSSGLMPYILVVSFIVPFYFVVSAPTSEQITIGVILLLFFFAINLGSFRAKDRMRVVLTIVQMATCVVITLVYGYVYLALPIALYIGNIRGKLPFGILYSLHALLTFLTINYGFHTRSVFFMIQFPFVILCLIGVVLIPFNQYSLQKRGQLRDQLADANKRIADLIKQEERERISRDLHDTLGQKLSLIGLKSELASKLIDKRPEQAKQEMSDIHHTARTALKEVRELVSSMRGTKVEEELVRVGQILSAAHIRFTSTGDPALPNVTPYVNNVLSMCIKEAVNNVVNHSKAGECAIAIEQSATDTVITIRDDGEGIPPGRKEGNGITGMRERLEFVNGSLEIVSDQGTRVALTVPNVIKQLEGEKDV